jgi:transposase InsO family protein
LQLISHYQNHAAAGTSGIQKRKYCITTTSDHDLPIAENLVNRNFKADKANQKWVADISYNRTNEGWLYLAVIIDLFSRKVVGWSMDTKMQTDLVLSALKMAIRLRKPPPGLIHHSDRGVQYVSYKYQNELSRVKMICSMSRKGNCWDNSVEESFFSSLNESWFTLQANKRLLMKPVVPSLARRLL